MTVRVQALPPVPGPVPVPAPVPVATPAPVPTPQPAPVQGPGFALIDRAPTAPAVTFDLRSQPPASPPAAVTAAPARPAAKPPVPDSIDDAFADFTAPSREVEPQSGAVDVRKVRLLAVTPPIKGAEKAAEKAATKAKDKAAELAAEKAQAKQAAKDAKDAKAAEAAQPSRIWVQIATGRDKAALGFDWRRLIKNDPAVFKGKKPFVTAWGQSNRLLAGPFGTQREASAFLAALKQAGVGGGFVWSSAAGQTVDALSSGK